MIAAAGCSSVYVVDSENASVGCGILVGLALRYLRDGMTASAIAEKLQEDKKKIVVIALLDTLEYLKQRWPDLQGRRLCRWSIEHQARYLHR